MGKVGRPKTKIKSKTGEKVNLTEVAYKSSSVITAYRIKPYNPDALVQNKGLSIYRDMRNDEQIKSILMFKKLARLSTGWAFSNSKNSEHKKFLEYVFKSLKNQTFRQVLYDLLSALDFGYCVSEINFTYYEEGPYKGFVGLKDIKRKTPEDFDFDTDDYGNLKSDGLIQFKNTAYEKRLSPDKFLVFSYMQEGSNYYGISDLRGVYRAWWIKDVLLHFRSIFLEKHGSPTTMIRHDENLTNEQKVILNNLVESIQSASAIRIPNDIIVELLEAKRGGEAGYTQAINECNIGIARGLLAPDLLGFTKMAKGSFALGAKQHDLFLWVLDYLGNLLEEVINLQLIPKLIRLNFEDYDPTDLPEFQFDPIEANNRGWLIEFYYKLLDSGIVNLTEDDIINEFRKKLGIGIKKKEKEDKKPKKESQEDIELEIGDEDLEIEEESNDKSIWVFNQDDETISILDKMFNVIYLKLNSAYRKRTFKEISKMKVPFVSDLESNIRKSIYKTFNNKLDDNVLILFSSDISTTVVNSLVQGCKYIFKYAILHNLNVVEFSDKLRTFFSTFVTWEIKNIYKTEINRIRVLMRKGGNKENAESE